MALSENVRSICRQHFARDCRGCPLQQACQKPVVPLTHASLDAWRNGLETAADVAKRGAAA